MVTKQRQPSGRKPFDEEELNGVARVELRMKPETRKRLRMRALRDGVSMTQWATRAVLEKLEQK